MKAVVDVDDLIEEQQIQDLLMPLRFAVPALRVTAYAVPNRLGPVDGLKKRYPWITFGIHGFEHTFAECRAWTSDLTEALIGASLEMGYDRVFKAPNWILDSEVEEALAKLRVTLHHHEDYKPSAAKLYVYPMGKPSNVKSVHTHLIKNPATDHISEHPGFTPDALGKFREFLLPMDVALQLC